MENTMYVWSYCKFSQEKSKGILLFNALNPMDKVNFVDVHKGDTRVRRADSIFNGRENILCPSGFIDDDIFNVGCFSAEHEFAFLKRLKELRR